MCCCRPRVQNLLSCAAPRNAAPQPHTHNHTAYTCTPQHKPQAQESREDLLRKAREQREQRQKDKQKTKSAVCIQSHWRQFATARSASSSLRQSWAHLCGTAGSRCVLVCGCPHLHAATLLPHNTLHAPLVDLHTAQPAVRRSPCISAGKPCSSCLPRIQGCCQPCYTAMTRASRRTGRRSQQCAVRSRHQPLQVSCVAARWLCVVRMLWLSCTHAPGVAAAVPVSTVVAYACMRRVSSPDATRMRDAGQGQHLGRTT